MTTDATPTPESATAASSDAGTLLRDFPARRVTEAKDALARWYRAQQRTAKRTGDVAPAAPTLTVVREGWISQCSHCHCRQHGVVGGTCIACKQGVWITWPVVDLQLDIERPVLAGWEFLAVVEPLPGGNLIRQVPHANVAEGELAAYRKGALECAHCNLARIRHETFIIRSTADASLAPGSVHKQVGRSCLQAFFGGKSPAAILASIGWRDALAQIGSGDEDGEGGGGSWRGSEQYAIDEFLSYAASVSRLEGFVTKKNATDDKPSTASRTCYLMSPPWSPRDLADWRADRERCAPTDADRARAAAALAWVRGLGGLSDYEHNLVLACAQPALEPRHAGIVASALGGYDRAMGKAVQTGAERANNATSEYVATPGAKKVNVGIVQIQRVIVVDTQYGDLFIHTFRDASGNALVWRTSKAQGVAGDKFLMIATVKAHSEFRGEKQTEVMRADLLDPSTPTPVVKPPTVKRPRKKPTAGKLAVSGKCDHGIAGGKCTECNATAEGEDERRARIANVEDVRPGHRTIADLPAFDAGTPSAPKYNAVACPHGVSSAIFCAECNPEPIEQYPTADEVTGYEHECVGTEDCNVCHAGVTIEQAERS